MRATLTELNRHTAEVVRPVIHGGKKVVITHHGKECAEIRPMGKFDRKAALEALRAIGPVNLPPRK